MIAKSIAIAAALIAAALRVGSLAARPQEEDRVVKRTRPVNGRLVMEKARAFIISLSSEQRAEAIVPFSFCAASHWPNLPEQDMLCGRHGLPTEALTPKQWEAVNAVLKAATGSGANEGFDEIQQMLNADDFISQKGRRCASYGRGQYHIAFLGEPAAVGRWQLQFGAHH